MGDSNKISLKAMVDKESGKVLFAESNADFIDVIFSFLTMPLGTLIRLKPKDSPDIGCMNKLYESVKKFDDTKLRTKECKTMLLSPRNVAETECKSLKLIIDDDSPSYFLCSKVNCTTTHKLVSHYEGAVCRCGNVMNRKINLSKVESKNIEGVFVKGPTRLLITDDMKVIPPSFPFLSKLGVKDWRSIVEKKVEVGVNEVLSLFRCSLVSKTPLTETLLKVKPESSEKEDPLNESHLEGGTSDGDVNICVKIFASKSKHMIYYAEAGEDFVDLLFSFLTLPLGYIAQKLQGRSSKGSFLNLFSSLKDFDAVRHMNSAQHKAMLVNPKVVPGFRYEKQPLIDIEEVSHPYFYSAIGDGKLITNYYLSVNDYKDPVTILTVVDPKIRDKEPANGGGFVKGQAKFTITDNLDINLLESEFSRISLLQQLNVPVSDVQEHIVHVGNEMASWLLVSSFVSDYALTLAFYGKEPKLE